MTEPLRQPTPADTRRIFRRLDEVYDEVNARYCDAWTDHAVAVALGVPRRWVEALREEAFGPVGRNREMDAVAAAVGALHAGALKATDAAMAAALEAERLAGEARTLRRRVDALEAAVGPALQRRAG